MIQFPNRVPAHHSDEVPWDMFGVGCEMSLDSHQVISPQHWNWLPAY